MAKAVLTNIEVHAERVNYQSIYDISGREVSSIRGPTAYEYHLIYTSFEPFGIEHFPSQINTEEVANIVPTPVVKKEEPKEEMSKPKKFVSAIGQLEVSETIG